MRYINLLLTLTLTLTLTVIKLHTQLDVSQAGCSHVAESVVMTADRVAHWHHGPAVL